ncbi:ATP-dependent 3'-5' DNA helicase [Saccharomycopsis crataegensis]|uniref:ATP-dependent 3'-5' DNA helicase n=1 Tax=Saccharomycopsis crataegensis TaxID=43959 RepID=A0AAV5QDX5_9ASCO|nr:ATP-dependent 3'-5' DNA helicase [Saccharomycopsis crataegensis]
MSDKRSYNHDDLPSPSSKRLKSVNSGDDPDAAAIIPKTQWPSSFQELDLIHFRFNSYFSFISTRNHVLPTYDIIKPNVEKSIKRSLQLEDIAKLMVLLPSDISFKYVDENQIYHIKEKIVQFNNDGEYLRKDVDMFKLKDIESTQKQILLLEFIDGNPLKSKANENYKTQNYSHPYNPKTLKKVIDKRNKKFINGVSKFLTNCASQGIDDPMAELTKLCQQFIPEITVHIDPIEAMKRNKDNGLVSSERPKIVDLVEELKADKLYKNQIVEDGLFKFASRQPVFKNLEFELPLDIYEALFNNKKVEKFYSHQAEALNAINDLNHVIITTSTSSGKSLIYQLPAMKFIYDYIIEKTGGVATYDNQLNQIDLQNVPTAMYIFPTKALAQDQKRSLKELFSEIEVLQNIVVETFDGDTSSETRNFIRDNSKVIFTNPDMLHANILPNYQKWRNFLRNLKIIVIDELHIYRGLFGSHVALVIRRLRRICHYLGNDDIQFISCSATLKDPVDHMKLIFGINESRAPIVHVSEDGSPSGEKYLVVWNPPLIDERTRERESFITETAKLLIKMVLSNVKTICFCVVRRTVELLMKEVRSILKDRNELHIENQIMSYRGGYSISDRREIEKEMFEGNLKAIIATNALELGIDIGTLDAVLICGFPISISNFHQQSGRAGRRNKDSLTLYVGAGDPVNQYYMDNPKLLTERKFQDLVLDFNNVMILEQHLQCAGFELPINLVNDEQFFVDDPKNLPEYESIVNSKLVRDDYGYHCHPKYLPWPSKHVSLRGIEEDMFAVVDITNDRNVVIEEIETSRTSFTLYEEGILIHQGLPYIVREFNAEEHFAKVERVSVDWVTKQRDFTDVDPMEIEKIRSQKGSSDVPIYYGKIRTTIKVFGFFKVDKRGKILDSVDVKNPPVVLDSKGFWIDIPMEAITMINSKQLNVSAGIHGAEHAIINVMPLVIVSGIDEIQTECKAPEKEFAKRQSKRIRPARLIFTDSKGGRFGSGLSIKAFENIDDILRKAYNRVRTCPCEIGCPECIAAAYCKENSLVISKSGALIILGVILGEKINLDRIHGGPEKNLPDIDIETIEINNEQVKFSSDLEIIDAKQIEAGEEFVIKAEENEIEYGSL